MHPFKIYLLANAVVWATVILASGLLLRGSPVAMPILLVLGSGAAMSVGALGGALWRRF